MERIVELNYNGSALKKSCEFRKGRGESILLIHGLGCLKESFEGIWSLPRFRRHAILALDLPGFGDYNRKKNFSYTLEEHAEVWRLVVEKLGLQRIHLVGHSMGGAVGLLVAKRVPSKIMSFTSLESNLIGADCTTSREAIAYTLKGIQREGI